ncbi:MAG: prolyl oligopeptidase family serine peptidase [Caldilineaceae bacterium]
MQANMIGVYGPWAAALVDDQPGAFSFRHEQWHDVESWRKAARQRVLERMAQPNTGGTPEVTVHRQYIYDNLTIEELSWQLPYGPRTQAVLLKPLNATGKLPGIVGLHCHGGLKFFGLEKITRTSDKIHPLMVDHHNQYYGGVAWANELAKRGYVVLVHDAYAFASRRVRLADVPEVIRKDVSDPDDADSAGIQAYNRWAGEHEHIMAKSLFSAGTTWPGVFLAEDQRALDVLCARAEVDPERIGCCGLSGGGLRTVMLGGLDERIKCAVCVGMMTTWRDYLLNKSYTHTWMCYVPLLPNELDYSEILGLRAPRPTLVLNDIHDQLFTMPEMERADAILREVYAKAGASERYHASFYPGPHKFDLPMQAEAFPWFDRWLRS